MDHELNPEWPLYWHEYTPANSCPCLEELREASRQLIGECIVREVGPGEDCYIRINFTSTTYSSNVGDDYFERSMAFMAQPVLTEATALGLLHLLRHLSSQAGCVITDLNPNDSYRDYDRVNLNWDLAQPLEGLEWDRDGHRFPRLHCGELNYCCMKLEEDFPRQAARLFSKIHTIRELRLPIEEPSQIPTLIQAIESGGGILGLKRMEFECSPNDISLTRLNADGVNATINYFLNAETVDRNSCIAHVTLPARISPNEWPSSCPRESGVRTKSRHGKETWKYLFNNKHSDKEFCVKLRTCAYKYVNNGQQIIYELQLFF